MCPIIKGIELNFYDEYRIKISYLGLENQNDLANFKSFMKKLYRPRDKHEKKNKGFHRLRWPQTALKITIVLI